MANLTLLQNEINSIDSELKVVKKDDYYYSVVNKQNSEVYQVVPLQTYINDCLELDMNEDDYNMSEDGFIRFSILLSVIDDVTFVCVKQ